MSAKSRVVHWDDVRPKLPIGSDAISRMRRDGIFDAFDPGGNGILSQHEVVRSMFRLLPLIGGIPDLMTVLNDAFRNSRAMVEPVAHIGVNQMDRNQFRTFMVYVFHFLKLWELFCRLDETGDRRADLHDRRVTLDEFWRALPSMREWGFGGVDAWERDAEAVFRRMLAGQRRDSGCGRVAFEDLAHFCLRAGLPRLSPEGEEAERRWATEALRSRHPHLLSEEWGRAKPAPPVVPPGQKKPPRELALPADPGELRSDFRRWETCYMADFENPRRSPRNAQPAHSSSTSPTGLARGALALPARSFPGSPTGAAPGVQPAYWSAATGPGRSRSVPAAYTRARSSMATPTADAEVHRAALRSQLQSHLDMYNTMQMRQLLQVAGGMVAGPPAARNF